MAVTATTGMAATQFFGATTLHRWCALGHDILSKADTVDRLRNTRDDVVTRIKSTDVLIIDEVGMLSQHTFEFIEHVVREIRGSTKVFGSIQLIAAGSFTQLAPVPSLKNGDLGLYCFQSELFTKVFPHHVHLTQVRRQDEVKLSDMVEELCMGRPSAKTNENMNELQRELPACAENERVVLVGTNFAVDLLNYTSLHNPESNNPIRNYVAVDRGNAYYIPFVKKKKKIHVKCYGNTLILHDF